MSHLSYFTHISKQSCVSPMRYMDSLLINICSFSNNLQIATILQCSFNKFWNYLAAVEYVCEWLWMSNKCFNKEIRYCIRHVNICKIRLQYVKIGLIISTKFPEIHLTRWICSQIYLRPSISIQNFLVLSSGRHFLACKCLLSRKNKR